MDLIGPAPFSSAEYDCLLYAFNPSGPAHTLLNSFVGFGVDLVIAFHEKMFVKLEPDIVSVHHQYEVLIVLGP